MLLERLLQISVTVTVSVGGCILGLGEREGLFPFLIMICAFLSLVVTDFSKKFTLNTKASNLLTAVAAGYFFFQLVRSDGGRDTLVLVSHLLVLLEILIFFRAKTVYTYWLLILLSFQQVVLTAAFPQPMVFGVMIFLYFIAAFTSVYLLAVFRRQQEMVRMEHPSFSWFQPLPPLSMPLFDRKNIFMFLPRHWFRGLLSLLGMAILFGTVGFLFCPRVSSATFRTPGDGTAEVGFSDTIRLGGLGELLQNHDEVFRVRLYRTPDARVKGDPIPPSELPDMLYLRGAVLNHYERGSWCYSHYRGGINPSLGRRQFANFYPNEHRLYSPPRSMDPNRLTWMEFQCDANTGRDAFAVWPFYAIPKITGRQLKFNPALERLENIARFHGLGADYALLTPALQARSQSRLAPCFDEIPKRSLLQLPPEEEIPTMYQQAEEWHQNLLKRNPNATPRDVATEFTNRFLLSSKFRYSLKPQPRTPEWDPIEDFLKNHPVGHCEYFASALALMLRSRGVPARVVVGLVTDEVLSPGSFFIARQSHAHSWVEVKLEADDLPVEEVHDSPWREADWRYGGWLRLDPTPSVSADMEGVSGWMGRAARWLDTMESLWSTYVLRLNRSQQRDSLYAPVRRFFHQLFYSGTPARWWLNTQKWLKEHMGNIRDGILTSLVFIAVLTAVGMPLFFLVRRWRIHDTRSARRVQHGNLRKHNVTFYQKLERELARRGYRRTAPQTSLEFVRTVPSDDSHEEYEEIVKKYYEIRFGHHEHYLEKSVPSNTKGKS